MRTLLLISVFVILILVMDLYFLRGIRNLGAFATGSRSWFPWVFWSLSIIIIMVLSWAGIRFQSSSDPAVFWPVMLIMGIFLMIYVPKLAFNLLQALADLSSLILRWTGRNPDNLRTWFLAAGALLGILLFIGFGWGMIRGRTHIKVIEEKIPIAGLPPAFEGIRIVQLSDIHLAGFYRHQEHMEEVVQKVNSLGAELILFTGDMVHNFSAELEPFLEILQQLKAPMGKYAVLGNHDYGDYFDWPSEEKKKANLDLIKQGIREAGFDLLLNEHRTLSINGDSIDLLGVENWGKPPFPQYGDLSLAMKGSTPDRKRILMSHDPTHWDLEVKETGAVDLTLSGHTHGMQFGIEIGDFRWSPSGWIYKQWAGLYCEDGQYLYVNRGLGYTGFPGRVGIRPEITLLTLVRGSGNCQ